MSTAAQSPAFERHFSPQELAKVWALNPRTIRDIFRDEPGVLKVGREGRRSKRAYVTLRIPATVAQRVYERRSR